MEQEKKNRPLPSGSVLQTQLREAPTRPHARGPSPTANRNQNRTPQEPIQAPAGHEQTDDGYPGPEFIPGSAGVTHAYTSDRRTQALLSPPERPLLPRALRPTRGENLGTGRPLDSQDKASVPNDRVAAAGPSLAPGPDFIPLSGPSSQGLAAFSSAGGSQLTAQTLANLHRPDLSSDNPPEDPGPLQ